VNKLIKALAIVIMVPIACIAIIAMIALIGVGEGLQKAHDDSQPSLLGWGTSQTSSPSTGTAATLYTEPGGTQVTMSQCVAQGWTILGTTCYAAGS
jgi:hypothetical protein